MSMIADILLVAAAIGATFYCVVLSRRLNRFNDLEKGVGGAIAVLSAQVDDMTRTLQSAQGAALASAGSLGDLTGRAEDAARRLELLVASMHDLPGASTSPPHPAPQHVPHPAPRPAQRPAMAPTPPRADPLPLTDPVPGAAATESGGYEPVPMPALFLSSRNLPGAA